MKDMAKLPPPPRKPRLDLRLEVEPTANNLSEPTDVGFRSFVDLNHKVEPGFQSRWRMECTIRGLSSKQLLKAAFLAYLDANGGTYDEPAYHLTSMRKKRKWEPGDEKN